MFSVGATCQVAPTRDEINLPVLSANR